MHSLKIEKKLDPSTKERIKIELQQYAKQQTGKKKSKTPFIWASIAAAVFLCSTIVLYFVNQSFQPLSDQTTDSLDFDSQQTEIMEDATQFYESDEPALSVITEETDEDVASNYQRELTNYVIEPYNISYQLDDSFQLANSDNQSIIYTTESKDAEISLQVDTYTTIEQVQYHYEQAVEAEEIDTLSALDYPYDGLHQYRNSPLQGQYFFQINQHVLVIQYQYDGQDQEELTTIIDHLAHSIQ